MIQIGVYEAKTQFPALLRKVQKGEQVLVTRHGVPLARIIPSGEHAQLPVKEVIGEIRKLRKGKKLSGITIRQFVEAGRK